MSRVSIAKCDDYDQQVVNSAVAKVLADLGGIQGFAKSGQTVLLKPNFLGAKPPELAVTTHPAVMEAVALEVLRIGATPVIGDSPPYQGQNAHRYERLCEITGARAVADRLGIEIVSLDHPWREIETGGKLFRKARIASAFLDADVVINLPKLKTHGITGLTGAVKNMFGCVPGLQKSQLHLRAREDREAFSQMIVDVFSGCRPTLNVMDAIVGMEGSGPSNGRPKNIGVVLASADAVALDSVAAEIVGMAPASIAHLRLATEQGLGCLWPDGVEIVGEDLESVSVSGFKPSPVVGKGISAMPAPLYRLLKSHFVAMPRVIKSKCVGCGDCVKVCAVAAMELKQESGRDKPLAEADLRGCIACYCCDEACGYDAIDIRKGWLGKRKSTG